MGRKLFSLCEVVFVYIILILVSRLSYSYPLDGWLKYGIMLLSFIILVFLAVSYGKFSMNGSMAQNGGSNFWAIIKYLLTTFFLVLSGIWSSILLVFMSITRRDLSSYGITIRNPAADIKVVALCIIPSLLVLLIVFFNPVGGLAGTAIICTAELLLVFGVAILLKGVKYEEKSTAIGGRIMIPGLMLGCGLVLFTFINPVPSLKGSFWLAELIIYAIVFGFVLQAIPQQILFGGYIQPRLNEAFGRPCKFFEVNWGAGLVLTAILFGMVHVLNGFNPFSGYYSLNWLWGIREFFDWLFYGFLREKTGNITAPLILHGIWDTITYIPGYL